MSVSCPCGFFFQFLHTLCRVRILTFGIRNLVQMNQARLPAKKTLRARRAGPAAAPRRGRAGAKKAGDVKKTKAAGMATRYAQPQLLPAAQQPAPVPLMPPPAAAPTARDRLPAAPPKKTNAKRAPPAAYVPNQNYNQPVNLGVARATHETYDAVNAPPINPFRARSGDCALTTTLMRPRL